MDSPPVVCGSLVHNSPRRLALAVGYSVDRTSLIVRNALHPMLQEAYVHSLCTNEHACSSKYFLGSKAHRGSIHISTAFTGTTVFLNLLRLVKKGGDDEVHMFA